MDESHQDIKGKAFKVIIVGPQAVGKSSILFRLSESNFNSAYMSTIGIDFKTYSLQIEGKPYSLQIWDTAGQEKFRALTSTYYKGSQGCVCVFDLSDPSTIERCDYYISKALEEGISKDCIFFIGNKKDIEHPPGQAAKNMAEKYEVQYEECSAKEGAGVAQIFNKLAKNLAKKYGDIPAGDSESLKPKVNFKEGRSGCCSKG